MRRPTILPTFIAFVCQLQVQSLQILTSQWFLVIAKQSKCHHPTNQGFYLSLRQISSTTTHDTKQFPTIQPNSPIFTNQKSSATHFRLLGSFTKTFPKWYRYLSLLNRSTDLNCTCWTAPAVAGVRGLFAQGLAWRSDCKSSLVGSSSPNRLFQGRRTFEDSQELETVGNHPTCLFILFSWAQTVGNKRRHGSLELKKTPFEHTQRSMPKPNLDFSDSVQEHSNMTSTSDHVPRKLHQVSLSFPMTRAVWWSFLHGAESPNSDSTISWSLVLPDMGNMQRFS